MTELSLRKTGQILFPHDEMGKEAIEELKNGVYKVKITKERSNPFFRKWWKLVNFAFEHWDVDDDGITQKNIEYFRKQITILAGFYIQVWKLNGDFTLEAKSLKFSKMDEVEFTQLYDATFNVILKNVLRNYTKDDLEAVVLELLRFD